MKTKQVINFVRKFYLYIAASFFVTALFFSFQQAKADDCSECVSAYGEGFCIENGFCSTVSGDSYEENGYTQAMCDENYGKGYVPAGYGCVPAPTSTTEEYIEYGYTQEDCNKMYGPGYVPNGYECVKPDNSDFVGPVKPDYTYSECKSDGGDEAYCGQFVGAPESAQNLSSMSDGDCKFNSDCGTGFTCYQQSCVDDQTYEDNTAWYSRAGNAITQTFTPGGSVFSGSSSSNTSYGSSSGSISSQPIATTTQSIKLPNGAVAPSGTKVYSNGSGVSPNGTTYPAGSFTPQGDPNSGLTLCATSNGQCVDANGNTINGSPFVINSGFSNGNVLGVNGRTTPKCGTDGKFTEIGGVCFPNNTGLSNAPVYVILSNIFSWMMGLFTTLAVVAFVISGIQYLMASGDEDLAKAGKKNATNALIGIIVGLSGFIIIKAIAAALSGQGYFF